MLVGIILGIVWFVVFLVGHASLFHLREVRRRSLNIVVSFSGALIACVVSSVAAVTNGSFPMAGFGGVVIMLSLFVLYMPFYYTIATSLSVQTLIEIQREHQMPLDQLKAAFVSKCLLQRRLEAMVLSGLLQRHGSSFRLTRKGRLVARLSRCVKLLWRLGPGG